MPIVQEDIIELECMMQYLINSLNPETAKKYKLRAGSGLAANQIGLNKRMFVALFNNGKSIQAYKMINSRIVSHSSSSIYLDGGEGCLSINRNIIGFVPRHERVDVTYYNETGRKFTNHLRDTNLLSFNMKSIT